MTTMIRDCLSVGSWFQNKSASLRFRSGIRIPLLLAALVYQQGPLFAHPGHSVEVVAADSAAHYWLQPEHAIVYLIAGVAAFTLWSLIARRAERVQTATCRSRAPFYRRSQDA